MLPVIALLFLVAAIVIGFVRKINVGLPLYFIRSYPLKQYAVPNSCIQCSFSARIACQHL